MNEHDVLLLTIAGIGCAFAAALMVIVCGIIAKFLVIPFIDWLYRGDK